MRSKQIIVVGSSNMDLVAKAPRIPVTGETLTGSDFFMIPGGKGANQAVAAAKLGGEVTFIARLGDDVFATKSLENFKNANINTKHIKQLQNTPSGVALIAIDDNGKNSIIVVSGANAQLLPEGIDMAEADIQNAGLVVAQLETPIETIEHAAIIANKHSIPFVLDPAPAPARPLSNHLLSMIDVIKPNEIEAEAITGIKVTDQTSAGKAAEVLLAKGVKTVIITLGEKGFLLATKDDKEMIANHQVTGKFSAVTFKQIFTYSIGTKASIFTSNDLAVFRGRVKSHPCLIFQGNISTTAFGCLVKLSTS